MVVNARTRVKICGLTRAADIQAAVEAGADAIGFVFYPKSKRFVAVEQARQLRQSIPAFVDVVALFVNADPGFVNTVIDSVQPDLLQFHGDESPDDCAAYQRRYIRAFRVGGAQMANAAQVLQGALAYPDAAGWLFDTYSAGYGGSGRSFDRTLLADVRASSQARPLILAGGLDADHVANAVIQQHPYAVDVSSGVEESPGIKSKIRINAFMHAVQLADSGGM